MTQELSMLGSCLAYSRKSFAILRNNKEVGRSNWIDVTESQGQIILEDDVSGDLLSHNLIEKSDLLWYCSLCFRNFVYHIFVLFII